MVYDYLKKVWDKQGFLPDAATLYGDGARFPGVSPEAFERAVKAFMVFQEDKKDHPERCKGLWPFCGKNPVIGEEKLVDIN